MLSLSLSLFLFLLWPRDGIVWNCTYVMNVFLFDPIDQGRCVSPLHQFSRDNEFKRGEAWCRTECTIPILFSIYISARETRGGTRGEMRFKSWLENKIEARISGSSVAHTSISRQRIHSIWERSSHGAETILEEFKTEPNWGIRTAADKRMVKSRRRLHVSIIKHHSP